MEQRIYFRTQKTVTRKGPYDATFNEREMIRLVYSGEISIDERGRIWRIGIRYKNGKELYPVNPPRRAERRTRDGYLEFRAMWDGMRRYVQAHRLVWQYFHGDIPEGMTINHKNGVVDDNRPSNLELMDMSEQNAHSVQIGHRDMSGENNNNAKLTQSQVDSIRIMYLSGMKQKDIARHFNVSRSQVSRVARGESW